MDEIARRALMKGAAIGALAFTVGGAEVMLTPRQARVQRVPFRTLTADQATTLEATGEGLVPGGRQRDLAEKRAMPTIHLMGGTIMGNGAVDSVTNSYGQTHETPISGSPGREFSQRAARPIRPIRSSRCRCAARRSWRTTSERWLDSRTTSGHSAAAFECPSRRLSFASKSSAASAITVPGGKIASAPADVSAA